MIVTIIVTLSVVMIVTPVMAQNMTGGNMTEGNMTGGSTGSSDYAPLPLFVCFCRLP